MAGKVELVDAEYPSPRIIKQAAGLIMEGEVIVCPTDTGYAFAANALDVNAIAKVFELKGRSFSNPIHLAVSCLEEAGKYAYLNKYARHLAGRYLPGALTMVLPRKKIIPALLVAGRDTIGIRIPDNRVILELANLTNLPITTTSANVSGKPTPYEISEIAEQLGKDFKNIALVLDQGGISPPELSTLVDLTVKPPQLLRQGRINWEEICKALESIKEAGL